MQKSKNIHIKRKKADKNSKQTEEKQTKILPLSELQRIGNLVNHICMYSKGMFICS